MQAKGVSAFQKLIQLLLALDHLGILLLLHGMNVSNQLMTLRISRVLTNLKIVRKNDI